MCNVHVQSASSVCVCLQTHKYICMWFYYVCSMHVMLFPVCKCSQRSNIFVYKIPTNTHISHCMLSFLSVNGRGRISTAEGDCKGIKERSRHWHGRLRSALWLATASCSLPRFIFIFIFYFSKVGLPTLYQIATKKQQPTRQ